MVSVRREIEIEAPAAAAWDALRDVGRAHRAFAGVLADCRMESDDVRVVTFANGLVARERILRVDDERRRLEYSAFGGRLTRHRASFEVHPSGSGSCRTVWTAEFEPEAMEGAIAGLMDQGIAALKRSVERREA